MINNEIRIRKYKETDAQRVSEIGTKSWFFTYKHIFDFDYIVKKTSNSYHVSTIKNTAKASQYTQTFVATINGQVVGFSQPCYFMYWDKEHFDPEKMMLARIYVDPDYMRMGVGSTLLYASEQWIKNEGFDKYYLYVHKDNHIGLNFYFKHGFIQAEIANSDDEIVLKKKIK